MPVLVYNSMTTCTNHLQFIRRASKRFGATDALIAAPEDTRSDVSIFQLGDRKVPELDTSRVVLPDSHECLALFSRYFEFAMATYRFLHQPTVQTWLESYQTDEKLTTTTLSTTRRAIILLVLATASLYNVDSSHDVIPQKPGEESFMAGEQFFQAAQKLMQGETGPARLESVQARILTSLYLLNTSRLHQAWYSFGTATQLIVALGIHRSGEIRSAQPDLVVAECRKRSFWTAYTLDTYFSVMLGRPPYIQEAFADQDYPQLLNDKDLSSNQIVKRTKNIDCAITASILHAKVAAIVRQASKEQYLLHRTSEDQQLRTAARLNAEIAQWQNELPVFLSGAIQPESLIPMFRRQLTVLRIACAHAIMLINRPLMLSRHTLTTEIQPHVEECLSATKTALDVVLDLATSSRIFSAFWNIQVRRSHWSAFSKC